MNSEQAKEIVISAMREAGYEISIWGCGCCGGPLVKLRPVDARMTVKQKHEQEWSEDFNYFNIGDPESGE